MIEISRREDRPRPSVPTDAVAGITKTIITHHVKPAQFLQACETFGKSSSTKALTVIIEA